MIIAKFSGGRSSAYAIVLMILQGRAPDLVLFANTGIESAATYEFIRVFKERVLDPAGIPFAVLEFDARIYGRERMWRGERLPVRATTIDECYKLHTAADDGMQSPFAKHVMAKKRLPDLGSRTCTTTLKVETAERYLASKGIDDYKQVIGFRAEEMGRVSRFRAKDDNGIFPLVEAGIGRQEVLDYWTEKSAEWGLPYNAGSDKVHLSNCVSCFYSNLKAHLDTARDNPKTAALWAKMEEWFHVYRSTKFPEKYGIPKTGRAAMQVYAWTMKYLQRAPTKKELTMRYFNQTFGFHMVIELHNRIQSGVQMPAGAIPIVAESGGCDSGQCRLDI